MSRSKPDDSVPNPVDIHVGAKVKARRLLLGMSQEDLASSIGLTFQQVQKYERGTNRISVSRLVDICKSLRAPFDYFLEGAPAMRHAANKGFSDVKQATLEPDVLLQRDVLDLVRAYSRIKTPQLKKQLIEMAKAMGENESKNA